ncbi:MAG: histidinol phosphate phosphatase domain-containing protein [Elusimicrobia bacterium]|nr:histidinol phosphate phosphatase domain-containing protein [Elusimicrobiota bacterium]
MIDLHTHTFFSDGDLIPSELVCRAKNAGYKTIALTDHCDFSNMDFVIRRIKRITDGLHRYYKINVIAGCEITYVPPGLISKAVKQARAFGAKIVVVHGESPVEPVPKGTNNAAILSGCDILAHPGYITEKDVQLAKKNNVLLEITTRNGHRKGNLHIAELAKKIGAKLVMNTDTHEPEDLFNKKKIKNVLKEANLTEKDFNQMQLNSKKLITKIFNF